MEHIYQAIGFYLLSGVTVGLITFNLAVLIDFIINRACCFITDGDVKRARVVPKWMSVMEVSYESYSQRYVVTGAWELVGGVTAICVVGAVLIQLGWYPHWEEWEAQAENQLIFQQFFGCLIVWAGSPITFMLVLRGVYRHFKKQLKAHTSDPNAHKEKES